MVINWINLLAVSMAVAVVCLTVTKATVFNKVRARIGESSEFFGELFSCPYCFSHWVSVAFVLLSPQPLLVTRLRGSTTLGYTLDIIVSIGIIIIFSSLIAGLVIRSFNEEE